MMQISVASDIKAAMAKLETLAEARQFRFAVARTLTKVAYEVRDEVRRNMNDRFTLRQERFIKNGILVTKATKDNLTAVVYSRDYFMRLQEYGGLKTPIGNMIAIPTSMVRRTPKANIRKSDRPKNLGDKAEVIEVKGRKFLALKRARKGANNQRLKLLYLLIPRANIHERLGLNKDGQKVTKERFATILEQVLAEEVARRKR